MTIILPEGAERAWRAAHAADNPGQWNALAHDLVLEAANESALCVRDDIITLAMVACQHGIDLLRRLDRILHEIDEGRIDLC